MKSFLCSLYKVVGSGFRLNPRQLYTKSGRKIQRTKMDENLKFRENPIVMKITTPEFQNIFTKEVLDLKALFEKYNYEIRIAGGAVRDLLMGKQPTDLDFATTATPQQMKEMFIKENIRMVNTNGEKHGTITPRINDKENFEVTTLRIDVVTDGRHAEVEFTTDWKLDANRRDLTINSMFLGFDGSVYDYFFGYEDLQKKRVAFVGDPDIRIKEDFLRILRYFRFYGRIAEKADNHEDSTLQVIAQNVSGLENISGERIWSELKKILQGNFAGEIMKTMLHVGVGKYIGLPKYPNVEEFDQVWQRSSALNLHPNTLLAALLNDSDEAMVLHLRLKFSAYDRDLTFFIVAQRDEIDSNTILSYQKLVISSHFKQSQAVEYVKELLKYKGEEALLNEFENWEVPRFPINGAVLKDIGVPAGKLFGPIMNVVKSKWADSNFTMSLDEMKKMIPDVLEQVTKDQEEQRKRKN